MSKCYHIIDNQVYEKEPAIELGAEAESLGSGELEEQTPCFMVGDMPIPFGCSMLTLPSDFQVTENKDEATNLSQGETAQPESPILEQRDKFISTIMIQSIRDDLPKNSILDKPNQ